MSRSLSPSLAALAASLATWTALSTTDLAAAQPVPVIADVPVRSVVLYSSGVGYVEHRGDIDGAATAELRFKTAQINDVLKSLIVDDPGNAVGSVVYPSQDPIAKTLRSFQIDLSGAPTLPQLLQQLRGAKLSVEAQAQKLSGTILGVETRPVPQPQGAPAVTVHVLSLVTATGIRQVPLDSVSSLSLDDPALQSDLERALGAVAQARDVDKKPVRIGLTGAGKRAIRLGYVIETPVWKTSYRLVLPAKPGEPGQLIGWAIVENQTDNDWTGINLSFVSGRPVSFVQDLYRPLYLARPEVQPELFAGLRPANYEEGMGAGVAGGGGANRAVTAAAAPAPTRGRFPAKAAMRDLQGQADGMTMAVAAEDRAIDATGSFAALAAGEKVGEQFQYTVRDVSLPRQRSAMIPMVSAAVGLERVSIYNPDVQARHPLAGALLTNTTTNHLPSGPATVLEGAYAGDAQLGSFAPQQTRLISYALDLPVRIDGTSQVDERAVTGGTLSKGVLHLTVKLSVSRTYLIEGQAGIARSIVIEHRRRPGWSLAQTPAPLERTETHDRFKVALAAGTPTKFVVREEYTQAEGISIVGGDSDAVASYAAQGSLPKAVREALTEIAKRKAELADVDRQRAAKQQELNAITADQARIRENMRSVQANSPYAQRLLAKLNEQEDKLDGIAKELERLTTAHAAKRQELDTHIAGLELQ